MLPLKQKHWGSGRVLLLESFDSSWVWSSESDCESETSLRARFCLRNNQPGLEKQAQNKHRKGFCPSFQCSATSIVRFPSFLVCYKKKSTSYVTISPGHKCSELKNVIFIVFKTLNTHKLQTLYFPWLSKSDMNFIIEPWILWWSSVILEWIVIYSHE